MDIHNRIINAYTRCGRIANPTERELTLPKDANIYAQQYALCLPDKALLQQKLREWIVEFKEKEDEIQKAREDLK